MHPLSQGEQGVSNGAARKGLHISDRKCHLRRLRASFLPSPFAFCDMEGFSLVGKKKKVGESSSSSSSRKKSH